MTNMTNRTNATNPSPPSFKTFLALPNEQLLPRMRNGVETLDPRIFEMSQEQLNQHWPENAGLGTWPIRVNLGHLADVELVLTARIRRIFSEDNPTLHLFDEHAPIDAGLYGCSPTSSTTPHTPHTITPPIGGDVATIHTLRCWLVAFLFQLEPHHWKRTGLHPQKGPVTIRDLAVVNCWHLEHHAWFINAKAEKILGPLPKPTPQEPCDSGGCGKQGCQCIHEQHETTPNP